MSLLISNIGSSSQQWWSIFLYDSDQPLNFSTALFWYLFAGVLLMMQLIQLLNKQDTKVITRNLFLLAFSLFFYYKSSGWYFSLLLFSTVVDFLIGRAIFKSDNQAARKWLVALSVSVNLGVLAFYKYSYFVTGLINDWFGTSYETTDYLAAWSNMAFGSSFDMTTIFLPVGISFYTFQTISYSIDLYRGDVKPVKNIFDFAFYVSFFPQLVAGPIVRASEFIPQIYQKYSLSKEQYNKAVFLIVGGLIKKILISDYLSVNLVDRVFEDPLRYTGFENLMGVYGYTIQIYCDFSAYSDIAIGLALLLGFGLPANFNSPYKSLNITDFWRRWHISLSSWLRDYLYIPLGGNRKGLVRTYINLFLTMLLGGLWHGAHIKFIAWGALHGVALAFHKWWLSIVENRKWRIVSLMVIGVSYHLIFVLVAWIHFGTLMLTQDQLHGNFIHTLTIIDLGFKLCFAFMAITWGIDWLVKKLFSSTTYKRPLFKFASFFLTFHFVMFCWLFFRARDVDVVSQIIQQIYYNFRSDMVNQIVPGITNFTVLAGGLFLFYVITSWLRSQRLNFIYRGLIKTPFRQFVTSIFGFSLVSVGFWLAVRPIGMGAFDGYNLIFLLLLLGFGLHWMPKSQKNGIQKAFGFIPDPLKAVIIAGVILFLFQVKVAGTQPFIYFQF